MSFSTREDLLPLFTSKCKRLTKPRVINGKMFIRCELTGEVVPYEDPPKLRPNIYGKPREVNRLSEEFKRMIWLRCLQSYVYRDDVALQDHIVQVPNNHKFFYLEENQETLLEEGDIRYATDTDNYIDPDCGFLAHDTDEWYENRRSVVFIEDMNYYVTRDNS